MDYASSSSEKQPAIASALQRFNRQHRDKAFEYPSPVRPQFFP
jgi:hypothetical protein